MMRNNKGKKLVIVGLLLMVAALSLAGYNLYEGAQAKRQTEHAIGLLDEMILEASEQEDNGSSIKLPKHMLNPKMEMPTTSIDGVDYIGILNIPALELELPIISHWSYPYLKVAPCRYQGSAYRDDLIIAAHNYSFHFGKIEKLSKGDAIRFTDIEGHTFSYEVVVVETLSSTAIEKMVSGDYALTLFTCTKSGKSRVTVRCQRVKE